ncbi:hypothetical protein GUJ93_ZPchr0003g18382 [Zizania palustris]|uniref:Band 7 domain-containing protein n=1 Tax=Zizania palustris TaxID=103762 RepID=A0A8J5S8W1_ZIZPA|nr:hypothetical protein GUJ93_ZPchr0003g18382 [Zizania palustris]
MGAPAYYQYSRELGHIIGLVGTGSMLTWVTECILAATFRTLFVTILIHKIELPLFELLDQLLGLQVVNRLRKEFVHETLLNYGVHYDKTWIYDKIHHEINQFCSAHSLQQVYIDMFDQIDETMKEAIQRDCTRYAPGIEIIGVRVTKPNIPGSIRRNFELMEEERTKALIAIEKQKVAEKEAETHKKIALSEAEKNAQVSKILMEQKLMEKDSSKRQQQIDNEIFLAREKALTDANYYRVTKEAEANKFKLTPEYLELRFIESIANNSKIFFGEKIPNMIMDQRMLRNYLDSASTKDHLEI